MRKSTMLLTLALSGSLALSGWLWLQLREARTLSREAESRLADPRKAIDPSLSASREAPAAVDARVAMTTTTTPAPQGASPPPPPQGNEAEWASYQQRLLRDPAYREAWKQQRRYNYAPRLENLVRVVGLSPEQANAVLDMQVEQELARMDRSAPDPADPVEAEQRQTQDQAFEDAHQARLQKFLGADKYQQLTDYMQSRRSRMQVDRFRSGLGAADALRDDQVEPLIAALHVEQTRLFEELDAARNSLNWDGNNPDTLGSYEQKRIERTREAHARMHASAANILSTSQLHELDDMLRRQREQEETQQRIELRRSQLDRANASLPRAD